MTGRGNIGRVRWFELNGLKCTIPLCVVKEIDCLKGESFLFPDSFYDLDTLPRCLYKSDGVDMPLHCKGTVQTGISNNRPVNICLHGLTSPAKWHFSVLKHVLCIPPYGKQEEKELWEAFEGEIVEDLDRDIISKCRENYDRTSCNEWHCREKSLFAKVHPSIKGICARYLKKALSFFLEDTEKKIKVKQGNRYDRNGPPHEIEVVCRWKHESSALADAMAKADIGRKVTQYEATLVLRGFSFDWKSNSEPTIHLQVITLYSGNIRGKTEGFNRSNLIEIGTLRTG